MSAGWPADFAVARYRFDFEMRETLHLPEYAGSMLRGGFGAALRRVACMTGASTCKGCPLLGTCPYPAIFESPPPSPGQARPLAQVANPYVIEPPPFGRGTIAAGDTLRVEFVAVGEALRQVPLVVHAWRRAGEHGFGRARAPARLREVAMEATGGDHATVWSPDVPAIARHPATLRTPSPEEARTATLHFETPLRLQRQGHPLGAREIDARALMAALMRRITLLLDADGAQGVSARVRPVLDAAAALRERHEMRWVDWTRYSSRQKQEMTLGGLVGAWHLEGDLAPVLVPLWIGQWLHAGKNATMGMGRYRLELHA